jgi:hypothetical protein
MRTRNIFFLSLFAVGCNPYTQRDGEFTAGAVDPVNFPPAYLGAGGDRTRSGRGVFNEIAAYVGGNKVGYFAFPFSTTQLSSTTPDPLLLVDNGMPNSKIPTPAAYVFDSTCAAPNGYVFDAFSDEVPSDHQGNIFTALPSATYTVGALPTWSYVPVVSEVRVHAGGLPCQAFKSDTTLLQNKSAQVDAADGKYLAWPIIDVAAAVYRLGQDATNSGGWGTQKLGWYNHYIVAYLDGGYIPTTTMASSGTDGGSGSGVRMQKQRLFYPRSMILPKGATAAVAGAIGAGYDVLEAERGDANFSPVCAVFTYDLGATVSFDKLPQNAADITGNAKIAATLKPAATPYLFCLQVP